MTLSSDPADRLERARLSLEGLSLGDAFGERFFCLDPERFIDTRALPGAPWRWTDDTAMAISIVDVLSSAGAVDQDALAAAYARRYAAEPWRGYGGTAHKILQRIGAGEVWVDVASEVFGGTGSMGNGAAMRVGPLGAYFADDLEAVVEQARASAEPTHMHPEGKAGAIAIALTAAWAARRRAGIGEDLYELVLSRTPASVTREGVASAAQLGACSVRHAVAAVGNGSNIIAPDTVGFCVWCVSRWPDDYVEAMWNTVSGLGDRDTTCAIVGGVVAQSVGRAGLPAPWLGMREPLPS